MSRGALLAPLLLVAACASPPPSPDAFSFAVLGDTPYNPVEEEHFLRMMKAIDAATVAFAVHVGDMKGHEPCSDALFARRKAQFDASAHPFVYTPGDNEWIDCRLRGMGEYEPFERLAALRRVFFADALSLGRRRIVTEVQPGFPENRRWTHGGVVFATINVAGSDVVAGYDERTRGEAGAILEANRRWLDEARDRCESTGARGLVVFTQANPWFMSRAPYRGLIAQLGEVARRLRRPMLFVHGDTHWFHFDEPFVDAGGEPIRNLTRLETWGSPLVGWVKVTVDPDDPRLFRAEESVEAIIGTNPRF